VRGPRRGGRPPAPERLRDGAEDVHRRRAQAAEAGALEVADQRRAVVEPPVGPLAARPTASVRADEQGAVGAEHAAQLLERARDVALVDVLEDVWHDDAERRVGNETGQLGGADVPWEPGDDASTASADRSPCELRDAERRSQADPVPQPASRTVSSGSRRSRRSASEIARIPRCHQWAASTAARLA
jgi:hypothetical protein